MPAEFSEQNDPVRLGSLFIDWDGDIFMITDICSSAYISDVRAIATYFASQMIPQGMAVNYYRKQILKDLNSNNLEFRLLSVGPEVKSP